LINSKTDTSKKHIAAARLCCFAVIASLLSASVFILKSTARTIPADWTVRVTTEKLDHCLDFPNSKLQPFIEAKINFEQAMAQDDALGEDDPDEDTKEIPSTHYEDIFYGGGHLLGLKRLHQLAIRPGTAGKIEIDEFKSAARAEEASAASNAIVRLFLDALRRGAALKFVEVDENSFDLLVSQLNMYGFRPANVQPEQPVRALFILNVRSSSSNKTEDLLYGG
jgi:hypothetical protein